MELKFSHFVSLVSVLLIFHTLLKQVLKKRRSEKLPPGPWKLPLIGNLHQVIAGGSLPWRTFRDLARQHGPIMHLQIGKVSTVVVSSPRLAKEILQTHNLSFLGRPELFGSDVLFYNKGDLVFSPYGDFWRQMRKLCTTELFSNKKVSSYGPVRENEVSLLVSSLSSTGSSPPPINLSKKLFKLSCDITCRTAFGGDFNGQDLIPMISDISDFFVDFNVANLFPALKFLNAVTGINTKLQRMHQKFDFAIDRMMNDYRTKWLEGKKNELFSSSAEVVRNENFLDALIRLQHTGGFQFNITDANIKGMILDMFIGGTDTSSITIDWGMSEMLKNPSVMKKAQAEIRQVVVGGKKKTVNEADVSRLSYLKMVVKETLRLHPPLPLLFPRECVEACEIDGYTIPLKTRVLVNAWAIGRDPCVWEDSEAFKPERFENTSIDFKGTDFELLPFSAGRRMCPGLSFGISVVEIVLAKLLYHFDWKLPEGMNPGNLNMDEKFGITNRRKNELYVIAVPWDGPPY